MKKFLIPTSVFAVIIVILVIVFSINRNNTSQTNTISNTTFTESPTPTSTKNNTVFVDGIYHGSAIEEPYGIIQVDVLIKNKNISDISVIQTPTEGNSKFISDQAEPMLKSEVISSQSSNVDIITGATSTSEAYIQSVKSALSKAI